MSDPDPRIYFAAERTLLAWLRSGLTVMGLGFVVARFGLFLRLLSQQAQGRLPRGEFGVSAALGVLFVLIGAVAILVATAQHKRYVATLSQHDLPDAYARGFALVLSGTVGVLGLLLASYLVISNP